jgi:hypothetical protein
MRWHPLILAGLLAVPSALAQGTFQYTWHGASNVFQASFQVTADENQPGQQFYSSTFLSSIAIVSPDGTIRYSDDPSPGDNFAYGQYGPPLRITLDLLKPQSQREVHAMGTGPTWGLIQEFNLTDQSLLYSENGFWTATEVPEPSSGLLIPFGIAAWFLLNRLRARGAFRPTQ